MVLKQGSHDHFHSNRPLNSFNNNETNCIVKQKNYFSSTHGFTVFPKISYRKSYCLPKVSIRMDFIILESVNTQKSLFGDFPAALPQIPGFFALSQTTDMTGATPY
jgi:hypothetical protein